MKLFSIEEVSWTDSIRQPGPGQDQPGWGYAAGKDAYLRRLRRIEGQVRGLARMVEDDRYCIDILTQVSAINKALHAVSLGLVGDHIAHCVVGAARGSESTGNPDSLQDKAKEATAEPRKKPRSAFKRFTYPEPNGCWQIDSTEWLLADNSKVAIFQLVDDHSRLALASLVASGETSEAAIRVVTTAIERHGVPQKSFPTTGWR